MNNPYTFWKFAVLTLKKQWLTKSSIAASSQRNLMNLLGFATMLAILLPGFMKLKAQPPQQSETRSSYERFLATDRNFSSAALPAKFLLEVTRHQEIVKKIANGGCFAMLEHSQRMKSK
jgi:hypothetical protein